MTERDLIRRLENAPVPPPPEDLAARIINDIPAEVELHPELEHEEHRRRFHRRPVWMAAAAAVTIALTGAVTWELRHERPVVETVLAAKVEPAVSDPESGVKEEVGEPMVEGDAVSLNESTLEMKGDHDTDLLEAEPAEKIAPPAPVAPGLEGGKVRPRAQKVGIPDPMPQAPVKTRMSSRQAEEHVPNAPAGLDTSLRSSTTTNGIAPNVGAGTAETEQQVSNFADEIVVEGKSPVVDVTNTVTGSVLRTREVKAEDKKSKASWHQPAPSVGGTAEPNDQPFGDVFFEHTGVNPFVDSENDALSTFGLDVDTGSFTIARRYLRDGHAPPRAAIRVEEFVNAFDYGDASPRKEDFRLVMEGAPSVFAAGDRTYTLRLAVKARDVDAAARPSAVLVFCVDVSGSMDRENRLGLVKKALYELLGSLRRDDYVGLVVYGSSGRVLLRPTTNHDSIRTAIERLRAGGSTNAEEGLSLAYDLLSDGDEDGRIRRVILCSDGVANVGRTGPDSILERIRREASDGIELTTVGFGMGNYNDVMMEQLADSGNGRYAYVDVLPEARRIFVEELTGTLMTLGHDAKAQVEFDPDVVSRWRLLGYENRDIADHLFRDPGVDAGEIGAGHQVTAVYEVKLRPKVGRRDRVAILRLRYRPMGESSEIEMAETLRVSQLEKSWNNASPALKLASTVAEFAEILKGAYWAKDGDLNDVLRRVQRLHARDFEGDGQVEGLAEMVSEARRLAGTVSR